jgi:subtilisin family serine protease
MAKDRKRKTASSGGSSNASGPSSLPESNPDQKPFLPDTLDRTVIALPLLEQMKEAKPTDLFNIIIDVNLEYVSGRAGARKLLWQWIDELPDVHPTYDAAHQIGPVSTLNLASGQEINASKSKYSQQYLFGRLSAENIRALVRRNEKERSDNPAAKGWLGPLYRIWLDDKVKRFTNASISTVKADAARNAFGTSGKDILWAVVDTGIDKDHPHFEKYGNLKLKAPMGHRDFTADGSDDVELARTACIDKAGHGTHVAGIIAGQVIAADGPKIVAAVRRRLETGDVTTDIVDDIPVISGMAPQCKLLSLKVLDDEGNGLASSLIAALEYIQELNGGGRRIRVHGVNMSVGYDFEPKWFACGQSPLCVEVDRLVRSGVVVVVAAGNTGYGYNQSLSRGPVGAGQDVTINDPGNAELAITVGSTHRDMPHVYGVSYFSSKGPTGDGRLKPDIVAPGEKIISCQSRDGPSDASAPQASNAALYKEDSGTSMAAPHVSGVIAAFLSVRREFIGNPDAVKMIFMSTATDLKRAVYFQGKGLVDLMRAIQSV